MMSTWMSRSNPYSDLKPSFDLVFFKRFLRLLHFLFPKWLAITSLLMFFLLLLTLLEQVIIYNIGILPSQFYKTLGDKDASGFKVKTMIGVCLILSEAFMQSTIKYVQSVLYITWRSSLSVALHHQYFTDIIYYRLNILNKSIDNPDQRVTQDVQKLCDNFSQILPTLIIAPFTIAYYTRQAAVSTGYLGPVSVLVFFIVATVVNKLLMSPAVRFIFKQEKKEGDFRFKHMQIRMNSESAAFWRSGVIEEVKTNQKLNELIAVQKSLILRQYALNFAIKAADYLGSILSYIAVAVPIFAGTYDNLSPSDLSALISKNAFVTIYLINCFTRLIDLSTQVTIMAGTAHRVGQLFEMLGQLKDEQSEEYNFASLQSCVELDDESPDQSVTAFSVENLTYAPPKSTDVLCKDLSFKLESGVNILVTGDSGCGKSSLLRVINGLWPRMAGTIDKEVAQSPKGVLFLPQKPYFTNGTLREQIIYPYRSDEIDQEDDKMYKYLDVVHLRPLLDRVGGLDVMVDWNWYDELSPGEMQRLVFVRLFYHCPPFAVMDESTSQIGQELEAKLYTCCEELGITVMSVAHRDSVRRFHQMELNLEGNGGWSMNQIHDIINA